MGEEQKEENKDQEEKKEEVTTEEKKEEESPEIILKVDMHCEACAKKVERSLRTFEGVEFVRAESRAKRVVVKGKGADPVKVCERVQKKTGKKVELISPLPKPAEEETKEEPKEEPPVEEKKEEPKSITVVLKIRLHCGACAQVLQKRITKMEGVESVVTDLPNDQIIVKGIVDPNVLVENLYRRTRRQASIVPETEEKKEEEKKEEESKENQEENKEEEELKKYEYAYPIYNVEYAYPIYNVEYAYPGYTTVPYSPPPPPPEVFSDENPNACSIM